MNQLKVERKQARVLGEGRWLELALAGSALLLVSQFVPGVATWVTAKLAALPSGFVWALDVRNWHWAWVVRASLKGGWHGMLGIADPRSWSWVTFAVLSVIAIVALVGARAWMNREQS